MWLSGGGTQDEAVLILTQFLELAGPAPPTYPGEIWLCFKVADVDQVCRAIEADGGAIRRAAEDIAGWNVRAAVVTDPEGHLIGLSSALTSGGMTIASPRPRAFRERRGLSRDQQSIIGRVCSPPLLATV